jgi:hypothetical protein
MRLSKKREHSTVNFGRAASTANAFAQSIESCVHYLPAMPVRKDGLVATDTSISPIGSSWTHSYHDQLGGRKPGARRNSDGVLTIKKRSVRAQDTEQWQCILEVQQDFVAFR